MIRTTTLLVLAAVLLGLAADPAQAHRRGRVWGGVSIGIGLPLYSYPYGYGSPWYPGPYYYPTPVYAAPPVVYEPVPAAPAAPAAPDPIFYPRNGQSPAKTEADRQACNQWATTQPQAMADAGVFHRATLACMEGRGYTVR